MVAITSSGVGSGIDIESLISKLVAAEGQPVQNRLDRSEARLQAQLSALGTFQGAVAAFRGAVGGFTAASVFQNSAITSSDATKIAATATGTVTPGSYSVDVAGLATAHSLASAAFASKTEPVAAGAAGIGTLTFRFGTTTHDPDADTYGGFVPNPEQAVRTVAIDAANNSLQGIRDAVNDAGIGVSASIINDGSGFRLVFAAAPTGAANSLEISVAESGGGAGVNADATGLSRFAFNSSATNMAQTRAAQNASLSVNGLAISSANNKLTDVVEGLTLDLVAVGSATISAAQDNSGATKAVDAFINAYNKFIDTVQSLTRYDPATRQASVFTGDSMVTGAAARLHALVTEAVPGITGAYDSLAAIGIKTDPATGKLTKDSVRFNAALNAGSDVVGRLFAMTGKSSDALVRYTGAGAATAAGDYAVEVTRLATQGRLEGSTAPGPFTISAATNDSFNLAVDGVASGTITLSPGTYSGAELATALQTRINGDTRLNANSAGVAVTVTFDTDHFVIRSNRYGSASQVTVASGTAATALGLAAGTATAGLDVAGTIGGNPATGSGRALTGAGAAEGLVVEVQGGPVGARGTLTFARGIADRTNHFVESLLGAQDAIATRTKGIQTRIGAVGDQRTQLNAKLQHLQDRYRAQFTALDALVSKLQNTGNFLTQQLANLPGNNNS
ncbi:MAG: flagellar filament capping protein FliD [Porticoccaceae bacterium]